MESVNSTTFIKKPPPPLTDSAEKFLYTKELLSNRIFSGFFRERKYVAELNEYRDVVIVNPEESDLLQDIGRLRKKWDGVSDIKWVGITGSKGIGIPKAACFWVKLSNLAFGHYWFLIKHVKLKDGEIFLQLRCLRKVGTSEMKIGQAETYLSRNEIGETSTSNNEPEGNLNLDLDPKKVTLSLVKTWNNVYQSIRSYVTWRSLFNAVRTACAFVVFLVVGTVCIVSNLGDFLLKFLREVTLFVHAFSPIVVQIIDFLSKVVGGFYILLAGVFAGNRNRRQPPVFNNTPNAQPIPINWRERNQKLRRELYLTH